MVSTPALKGRLRARTASQPMATMTSPPATAIPTINGNATVCPDA